MFEQGWVFRVVIDGPVSAPLPGWMTGLLGHVTAIRWEQANDAGVARLPDLPRLRELDLSKSKDVSSSALAELGRFPGLWRLYLSGCEAMTQARIDGLLELRHLRLGWNPRLESASLNGLPELRTLSFVMDDVFRTLGTDGLPKLRELSLRGCVQLRDEDLAVVARLPGLEVVDCDGCTRLRGKGLHHLTALPGLLDLILSSCTGLSRVRLAGMPSLAFLDLGKAGIEALELIDLPKLEKIDLFMARQLRSIKLEELPALERVPVGDWFDLARLHIDNLPLLRSLNLSGLRLLRDLGLTGVPGLKRLDLRDCTSLGKARIGELRTRLAGCQVLG
jgi:hypothetical protein